MPITMYPGAGQQGPTRPEDPNDALAMLLGLGGETPQPKYGYAGAIPTQGELESPFERQQTATANRLNEQDRMAAEKSHQALNDFFLPGGAQSVAEEASRRKMEEESVAPTIAGQTARDVANIQNIGKIAPAEIKAEGAQQAITDRGMIPGTNIPVPAKISAESTRALSAIRKSADLMNQLEPLLDPKAGGIMNWLNSGKNWAMYKAGLGDDPKTDLRDQISGLLEVAGSAPYAAGSRNYQFVKQAMTHLTNPAATDANLYNRIQGLKQILPGLQQDILMGEAQPGADLGLGAPNLRIQGYPGR